MPLVDILNYLENSGVVNGMPQLGSPLLGGFFAPIGTELRDLIARGAPTEELEDYARRQGTGYWSCTLKFYGPAKAIAANWEYAQEKFAAIPGATFENGETFRFPLSSAEIEDITRNQAVGSRGSTLPEFGIPSLTMFSIGARSEINPNPTDGHMWFSPIIPRSGEAIFEANRVFAEAAKELDLPIKRSASACRRRTGSERSSICSVSRSAETSRPTSESREVRAARADRRRARLG